MLGSDARIALAGAIVLKKPIVVVDVVLFLLVFYQPPIQPAGGCLYIVDGETAVTSPQSVIVDIA